MVCVIVGSNDMVYAMRQRGAGQAVTGGSGNK